MSVEVVRNIWRDTRAEGSALLVLLAIGDHANTDGVAWPGLATLARKTRLSERQTRRHIATLLELGELQIVAAPGRGRATRIRVTCGQPHLLTDAPRLMTVDCGLPSEKEDVGVLLFGNKRRTSTTQKGDIHDTAYKEVEPSKNHQLEMGTENPLVSRSWHSSQRASTRTSLGPQSTDLSPVKSTQNSEPRTQNWSRKGGDRHTPKRDLGGAAGLERFG